MRKFGIFSPVMGIREDFPSILLNNSFTPDNSNVRYWNGVIHSAAMREYELRMSLFSTGTITLTTGDATVTGDGVSSWDAGFVGRTLTITSGAQSGDTYEIIAVTSGDIMEVSGTPAYEVTGVTYTIGTANQQVNTPDGNPVMFSLEHTDSNSKQLVAFTKANVYKWDSTLTCWRLLWQNSGDCTTWSAFSNDGYVIATNNVEPPIIWNSISSPTAFVYLDDAASGPEISSGTYIDRALFCFHYENYTVFGNYTTSGVSTDSYPSGLAWSDLGNETEYDAGDAGSNTIPGKGNLRCAGQKNGIMYLFKDFSTRKMWFTGTTQIFRHISWNDTIGCKAANSVVNDSEGNLYYFASNRTFREIELGEISRAINLTCLSIASIESALIGMCSAYITEYDEVWWAVPYGASATTNEKILCFNKGVWTERDCKSGDPVYAFASFSRATNWTWNTLPFSSWDSWNWERWDIADGSADVPVDLSFGKSGDTHMAHADAIKDLGSNITSFFVLTTDLSSKQMLSIYKRLLKMHLYVQNMGTGTMNVYVKIDSAKTWTSIGSISLTGTPEVLIETIYPDIRGRTFQFKFETVGAAYKFAGVVFEYEESGDV